MVSAWVLACGLLVTDVGSRFATISAPYAELALRLAALLAALLVVELVLLVGAEAPRWRLVASLGAAGVLIAARLAIAPDQPTIAPVSPLLLVAPVLLGWELWARWRRWGTLGATGLERVAATWCAVAGMAVLVLGVDPTQTFPEVTQGVGCRAFAWAGLLVAAGVALAAARARRRSAVARFGVIVVLAALVLVACGSDPHDGGWLGALAAAGIVLAALVPHRAVVSVGTRAGSAARSGAGAGTRAAAVGVEAGRSSVHLPGRCWRALLAFAAPPTVAAPPQASRRDSIGAAAMALLSIAFVAHGAWWAYRVGWQPTGHSATMMARAYDVGTANHPWAGMATSLGVKEGASHPGPLSIDLMAPFVRLLGVSDGARAGAVVVTVTCWAVVVWSAWRAAGRAAAVAAWAFSAVVLEIGALGIVWETNNITIAMFAIFASLMASWAAASGVWRAWWWAVFLGSLCSQSYLPHGLVVLGPVVWSGLAIAGARRAASDPAVRRAAGRALAWGSLIAVVVWLQPIIDVLIHDGGNVRVLVGQVRDPVPSVGVRGLPVAISWMFSLPPRWGDITQSFATAGTATSLVHGSIVVGAVVLALALVGWWRTRRSIGSAERQLRILTSLVLLGAAVNITRLPQENLRSFQLGWFVVASLCMWFTIGLGLGFEVRRRLEASGGASALSVLRIVGCGAAVATILVAAIASPDRIEDVKGAPFTIDALVEPAVRQTVEHLHRRGPVLTLATDTRLNEVATDTIVANLIVHGLDTRTERFDAHYGDRRIVDRWNGPMLWVTSGLAPIDPTGTHLASASVPGWSRARFDAVAHDIARRAKADGPMVLQPWVLDGLPRYLAGWVEHPCEVAERIRDGSYPVEALPPGLLLSFYGDLAVVSPQLSQAETDEARGLLGQAPVEVWLVETKGTIPSVSAHVIRDGSACRSPRP